MKKFGILLFVVLISLVGISFVIAKCLGPDASTMTSPIWSNFWQVLNNLVLLATLLVVAYYTYETYCLRKAAVENNTLSYRPILIFDAGAQFCTVKNKGYGPALNTALIIWDGKTMRVTADSAVPGIMAPGIDSYCFNAHIEVDSAGFKKRLPGFSSLIERITGTNHALFCLTYRDLAGNRFYSIINGSNEINYEGVFEHGKIETA
ncbi:hypothetical protein [Cellvibrio sp. PSBB023]|uniref:hypothetical protein n=1 Tax=Cellvibrio sp. PSBB023 TaxID=1945512 RepID=UPI00098EEB2B|nr:hypothetical protein [Cellvibrio sp. PSBB023]AQT60423.1 hypothetical protein B0D95_10180 [Cellvibrio sp. PSBB023]